MPVRFWTLVLCAIVAGNTRAGAQSSAQPQEILTRVAETQKIQAQLEAEMKELRGRLSSEVQKLKSWAGLNAEQRIIEWRMVAARVEMGFFAHDIVARTDTPGIEVRCQFTAGDDNKNLAMQFPPGTEFTCIGTMGSISPYAETTVITLRQSRAVTATQDAGTSQRDIPDLEITIHTKKVSEDRVKTALETFRQACRPLFTLHTADIVRIRASAGEPKGLFRIEQWGWGAEVHLTVELKQVTSTFPPEAGANGHTLHYFLGGGIRPGAQVQKRVSEIACGLPEASSRREDAFISIPELASILPRRS